MPVTYSGPGISQTGTPQGSGSTISLSSVTNSTVSITDNANATFVVGDAVTGSFLGSTPATYIGYVQYNSTEYPIISVQSGNHYVIGVGASGNAIFQSGGFACYLRGTRVLGAAGEVAVECLRGGDLVATRFGGFRPVKWVGVQHFSGRFLGRGGAPVRFRQGSIADNVPHRDLSVSPDHSIVVGAYLVPAHLLVNGITVLQDAPPERVDYYHIDLGEHDCVLADGAWAESYAEQNNRSSFHNSGTFVSDRAGSAPPFQRMCMEQITGTHAALQSVRASVVSRISPERLTVDPDLHLLADGQRVDAVRGTGESYVFRLPPRVRTVRLCSRTEIPAQLGLSPDYRRLGFGVLRIELNSSGCQDVIPLDGTGSRDGFHPLDAAGLRWTDGDARLPRLPGHGRDRALTIRGVGVPWYRTAETTEAPARAAA